MTTCVTCRKPVRAKDAKRSVGKCAVCQGDGGSNAIDRWLPCFSCNGTGLQWQHTACVKGESAP